MAFLMVNHWNGKIDHQNDRNRYLQSEIAELDQKIDEINDLKEKKEALVKRINVIQELQANRTQIVHMFDDLVKKMPNGVFLDKLNKKGQSFELAGKAQSNGRVSDLMRNLDSSDWFENPSLNVVNLDDSDSIAVSKFNLKVAETARNKRDDSDGDGAL